MINLKRIIEISTAVLLLILNLGGCKNDKYYDESCLTVYFFDVGQADSSFLIFPDGVTMLVDSGEIADGENIAKFIRSLGIKSIDYFVCTHPHDDHIGGAGMIFDWLEIGTVCIPKINAEIDRDENAVQLLNFSIEKEQCRTLELSANTVLFERSGYNATVISPDNNKTYTNTNDYSLSLLVNCYTNTILFMGDCESDAEKDIIECNINLDCDILKVGHHGSKSSSTETFLKASTPLVSVISCGMDNSYGHPDPDVVSRLNSIGSKVYRTDTAGTVIAKCYSGGFNIEIDREIYLNGN